MQDAKDLEWLSKLVLTLNGDLDGDGVTDAGMPSAGQSWAYWSWTDNSVDTGGILDADTRTLVQSKLEALAAIRGTSFAPSDGGSYGGTEPAGLMLNGGGGNDVLRGGIGDDFVYGGPGSDTAVWNAPRRAHDVTLDVQGHSTVAGPEGTDTLQSVESSPSPTAA